MIEERETLLIVEDNDALREGLGEMLSLEGFNTVTAANGRLALLKMNGATPDLILSDITMPEMDGFAFFKAVRSRPDWIAIPFIFLTARGERKDVLTGKNLGVEDYLVKPLTREELFTAVRSRLNRTRQLKMAQLQQAYEASLTALANAIDLRDEYTRGHVERVRNYALLLAEHLGVPEKQLEHLRFGAILHDIGKIHISEHTLLKDAALSDDEWSEVLRHPITGADMIKDIPYLAAAVPIIRYHHERWDGSGYPDHLMGKAIPVGARIVAVVDAFDAMTTIRPYGRCRSLEEAYQEILDCSGTQYDPEVVGAFQKAWKANQIHQIFASYQPTNHQP
jgi:putative two-component system response regulator